MPLLRFIDVDGKNRCRRRQSSIRINPGPFATITINNLAEIQLHFRINSQSLILPTVQWCALSRVRRVLRRHWSWPNSGDRNFRGGLHDVRRISRAFRRQIQSLDGKGRARHLWISEDEKATLIDPDTGKVAALVWHDGYGKYHPVVFVSPWRAIRLILRECSVLVSLLAFPRITVELYRLKTTPSVKPKRKSKAT